MIRGRTDIVECDGTLGRCSCSCSVEVEEMAELDFSNGTNVNWEKYSDGRDGGVLEQVICGNGGNGGFAPAFPSKTVSEMESKTDNGWFEFWKRRDARAGRADFMPKNCASCRHGRDGVDDS